MAWYDSIGDGWLWDSVSSGGGGGSSWWESLGSGWLWDDDEFDWSNLDLSDIGFGGGGGSSSSGGGTGFWAGLGNLLGGGSSGEGNIFGKMLAGGLGSMAEGLISEKAVKEAGKQARQNYSFQAELADFYNQKDKARKRAALDTYGQFSLMDRWAPGAQSTPQVDLPNKPQA